MRWGPGAVAEPAFAESAPSASPRRDGDLVVSAVRIPMRRPFSHAAHARDHAESLLVRCRIGNVTGWGEGAPRPYVTGETMAGARQALAGEGSLLLLEQLASLWASGAAFEAG